MVLLCGSLSTYMNCCNVNTSSLVGTIKANQKHVGFSIRQDRSCCVLQSGIGDMLGEYVLECEPAVLGMKSNGCWILRTNRATPTESDWLTAGWCWFLWRAWEFWYEHTVHYSYVWPQTSQHQLETCILCINFIDAQENSSSWQSALQLIGWYCQSCNWCGRNMYWK